MKNIATMTREEILVALAETKDAEVKKAIQERLSHMPEAKERVYKKGPNGEAHHPHGLFSGGEQTWVFGDSFLKYVNDPRHQMHQEGTYCKQK